MIGIVGVMASLGAMTAHAFKDMPEYVANSARISAFLVPPEAGLGGTPAGWTVDEADTVGVSELARRALNTVNTGGTAETLVTVKSNLPASDYEVAILVAGASGTLGQARIAGGAWVPLNIQSSTHGWVALGTTPAGTTNVTVEIDPTVGSKTFQYFGMLLEGSSLPVKPVSAVFAKLTNQQPVNIVMMGDSVTEDAAGTRGGSSVFANGHPGRLLAWMRSFYSNPNDVALIEHRSPNGATPGAWQTSALPEHPTLAWPAAPFTPRPPSAAYVNVLDGRNPRSAYAAPSSLVNLGKGGATSVNSWFRTFETFDESAVWRWSGTAWADTDIGAESIKRVLRHGLAHYQPDLVTINYGCNDANSGNVGRTGDQFRFRLKCLATYIQHELGAAVIISTPHLWTKGSQQNPHTQALFARASRQYAADAGLALADAYNEYLNSDIGVDGIHPGDNGHLHLFTGYQKALAGIASVPLRTGKTNSAQWSVASNVVVDVATGLIWTRDAQVSNHVAMTYSAATNFIAGLNAAAYGGYNNWRLPSRAELLAFINPQLDNPALAGGYPFTGDPRRHYLTTNITTVASIVYHWMVDVGTGVSYYAADQANGDSTAYVWPVRASGQAAGLPSWQVTHFGSLASANAATNADPDLDGQVNLAEYAFGTNPWAVSPAPLAAGASTNGLMKLLYRRAAPDVDYTVLSSPTLSPAVWATNTPVSDTDAGQGWREAVIATGNLPNYFMRMSVKLH